MARNTGDGYRRGAVDDRSQVYNSSSQSKMISRRRGRGDAGVHQQYVEEPMNEARQKDSALIVKWNNPRIERWTQRDKETGRFMDVKHDQDPFKGVRKEKDD